MSREETLKERVDKELEVLNKIRQQLDSISGDDDRDELTDQGVAASLELLYSHMKRGITEDVLAAGIVASALLKAHHTVGEGCTDNAHFQEAFKSAYTLLIQELSRQVQDVAAETHAELCNCPHCVSARMTEEEVWPKTMENQSVH